MTKIVKLAIFCKSAWKNLNDWGGHTLNTKLTNIHRVIKFNQGKRLNLYIDVNTNLKQRQKAKYKFEKDFYKPMNIAGFRKTMENARNHWD